MASDGTRCGDTGLFHVRRRERGRIAFLRIVRIAADRSGWRCRGDAEGRDRPLLRPCGLDRVGQRARPGIASPAHDSILPGDGSGGPATWGNDREVHRRRDHGGVRRPAPARGRRPPSGPGGRGNASCARGAERGVRTSVGSQDPHPDGRERGRGDRGGLEQGRVVRNRRRSQRRGPARAGSRPGRDLHRRDDLPAGSGHRGDSAHPASPGEREVGIHCRVEPRRRRTHAA